MDPKLTMDVPPQVREFAKESVDQAEKQFRCFWFQPASRLRWHPDQ
jgi:hypothetical protein